MRRALRVSFLVIAVLAAACAATLWAGRRLGIIREPVQWGRFEPASPETPPTMEEIERSTDSHGDLRGRVRRAADGHFEVRHPKDDGAVTLLTSIGTLSFLGFVMLRARRAP